MNKWMMPFVLALSGLIVTGCDTVSDEPMTARLWDPDIAFNHSAPAPSPNLEVYQTKNHKDLVVVYDEDHDSDGGYTRRAYLLNANQKRIEAEHRPHFTSARRAESLQPVPVETNSLAQTNSVIAPGLQAVLLPDQKHFELVSYGRSVGTFALPVYVNNSDRAWRIVATPVTLSADVTFYGSVAAVYAAYFVASCYCAGDSTYTTPPWK
jgi:hypothetical protein